MRIAGEITIRTLLLPAELPVSWEVVKRVERKAKLAADCVVGFLTAAGVLSCPSQ
jgi:hypothetical protein